MRMSILYMAGPGQILNEVTGQQIIDFYAIIGGSPDQQEFVYEINQMATTLYKDFIDVIKVRALKIFEDALVNTSQWYPEFNYVIPTLENFLKMGGTKDLYNKLIKKFSADMKQKYVSTVGENGLIPRLQDKDLEPEPTPTKTSIHPFFTGGMIFGTFENMKGSDDGIDEQDIGTLLNINKPEIFGKGGIVSFQGGVGIRDRKIAPGGVWEKLFNKLLELKGDLLGTNVKKKIAAIDILLGLSHHNGSILGWIEEPSGISAERALNVKFNAKDIDQFADKIDQHLLKMINKQRHKFGLPLIISKNSESEELYTKSHHSDIKS